MNKTSIQAHPFHLVEPSPWPLAVSLALLTTTISGVMYFNNYANGGLLLTLGLISTVLSMSLWFRDIIIEAKKVASLNLAVCWKLLIALSTNFLFGIVKILKIGQSAGNQKNFSNEILRDYTPSIDKIFQNKEDIIGNKSITKDNNNISKV
jgi:Cytochrome c oxidase subunit III